MRYGRISVAATLIALAFALPMTAQDQLEITFAGDMYDVTGAGTLELGDIDAVLTPYRREFRDGREALGLDVTVDVAGAVQECRADASEQFSGAGLALCEHALKIGRFRAYPFLALDYQQATYRLTVRGRQERPAKGEPVFLIAPAYPLEGKAVRFGDYPIPPADQRLALADFKYTPMDYPIAAMRNAIEARVIVAMTFDGEGRMVTCRPVHSSNTARIAYETCLAARRSFRLAHLPDPRPFIFATSWQLGD